AAKPFSQKQPRNALRSANFAPRNSQLVRIQLLGLRNDPSALGPDKFRRRRRTGWIFLCAVWPRKTPGCPCIDWSPAYTTLHRSVYLRKVLWQDAMNHRRGLASMLDNERFWLK